MTITRDDIEAKLREVKGDVDAGVERAKAPVLAIGAVTVVAVVGIAYLLGRRRGRKTTTVVEVRRV
jgi:signal transduction histidine kinase